MSLLERLQNKKKRMQMQIQRGRERTEQMKAEKTRRKIKRQQNLEVGTIRYGLAHRQSIGSFTRDAYTRRKMRRKEKEEKKKE